MSQTAYISRKPSVHNFMLLREVEDYLDGDRVNLLNNGSKSLLRVMDYEMEQRGITEPTEQQLRDMLTDTFDYLLRHWHNTNAMIHVFGETS